MIVSRRAFIGALGGVLVTRPAVADDQLRWSELPSLPLAVSGHFAGASGRALIVAGGAYFPRPLFEGGQKVWTDQVAVLEPGSRSWLTGYSLQQRLAYGASITLPDALVCIGGGDARRHSRSISRLRWRDGQLEQETWWAPLPAARAFHAAALLDAAVFVTGGQERPDGPAQSTCWKLDLARLDREWEEQPPCPGPARILPALAAAGDSLYLLGGCALHPGPDGKPVREYLRDAYRLTPGKGWKRIADLPRPVTAAPAIGDAGGRVLVFGGDDGELASRVQELKDRHPGFSRDVLAYDPATDRWSRVGTLPASLVTTNLVRWNGSWVLPGGEDRPGHRSPTVMATRAR
ncbi:MAG: sodium/solute symporter [Armatimonadetes bacterium]|nr:sodium/solute symporter [Armatimonadota bacterium]